MKRAASRRRLLRILGVAGAGSLAGCSALRETVEPHLPGGLAGGSQGADALTNFLAAELERARPDVDVDVFTPEFQYATEELVLDEPEPGLDIGSLRVVPAEGRAGDILRLEPTETSGDELVSTLLALWGVDSITERVRTDVDASAVRLRGGPGSAFAALSGVVPHAGRVVSVRGPTVSEAVAIATGLDG